jgi:ubiquinone/menaquinone biosynthesis C-methylase UbiE
MDVSEVHVFETVELEVKDFVSGGFILDIGGGGEGVIGRLKGKEVVAIDNRKDELEETGEGPLKIVMDARELMFLDGTFGTATLFFSLMYMKSREDHQKVLSEAWRVLKEGGALKIWDVDLAERPETDKEFYLVGLRYRVGEYEAGTGYGMKWPPESRSVEYYIHLAQEAGFRHISTERQKHTFHLEFVKPE